MARLCLSQPHHSTLNLCPERKVKTQQVYLPTARPPRCLGNRESWYPCQGEASSAPERTLLTTPSGRPVSRAPARWPGRLPGPPVFHPQVLSAATRPASQPAAADPPLHPPLSLSPLPEVSRVSAADYEADEQAGVEIRGTLRFLPPLEMRPSSNAPNPVGSREAPPTSSFPGFSEPP